MNLRNAIIGATLFGIGACYGKQAYSAVRNWYQDKTVRTDSALVAQTLTTLREHPALVDSYLRILAPTERQALIMRSSQMQIEYFLRAEGKKK